MQLCSGYCWLFGLVAVWGLDNAFGARKGARLDEKPGALRTLWGIYLYIAMFLPMAWYYFAGGIRALLGVHGEFNRTPKGMDERRARMPRINMILLAGNCLLLFTRCWRSWRLFRKEIIS